MVGSAWGRVCFGSAPCFASRETLFHSWANPKETLPCTTPRSLLCYEPVAAAANGGAPRKQVRGARWCWEPAGHIWQVRVVLWCRGTAPFSWAPGAFLALLFHPGENQEGEAKLRKQGTLWKTPLLVWATTTLWLRPPNAVDQRNEAYGKRKTLIRCSNPVLKGIVATKKYITGY